ncbi:MAG: hypothetical protein ABEJ24_03585 [Candidatus Magasanikbacteria bacterium]
MQNNQQNTIKMNEKFGKIVNSREMVRKVLQDYLDKKEDLVLDFSDAEFISRSAADEILKIKGKYEGNIKIVNTIDDVEKMIQTVAKSRAIPKKETDFNPKTMDIKDFVG